MTVLKDLKARQSRAAQVRSQLDFPVIDTDIHTNAYSPALEDYIAQYGGSHVVDVFRTHLKSNGLNALAAEWYNATPQERKDRRLFRPPFWALPSENTYDLATVALPGLLYERLEELGTDYAVLYPNLSLFPINSSNDDLRLSLTRAINHFHADVYKPYADRLTPVAAIPLNTPQEGIEELEFAQKLGLKTALIPGAVRRPVKAIAEKYPDDADLRRYAYWLDFFGIDSEYDYDPFWKKSIELGINLSTHSGSQSWVARNSPTNYMFNHINHFADASEALAKALFFGGVTRRFPQLRIALLEAGAAWGANVLTHLVDRFEKRGNQDVQQYNHANIDRQMIIDMYRQHGQELFKGCEYCDDQIFESVFSVASAFRFREQKAEDINDFALAKIHNKHDIFDLWVPNFYFGNEAADRTIVCALHPQATPFNQKV